MTFNSNVSDVFVSKRKSFRNGNCRAVIRSKEHILEHFDSFYSDIVPISNHVMNGILRILLLLNLNCDEPVHDYIAIVRTVFHAGQTLSVHYPFKRF